MSTIMRNGMGAMFRWCLDCRRRHNKGWTPKRCPKCRVSCCDHLLAKDGVCWPCTRRAKEAA